MFVDVGICRRRRVVDFTENDVAGSVVLVGDGHAVVAGYRFDESADEVVDANRLAFEVGGGCYAVLRVVGVSGVLARQRRSFHYARSG